MIASPFLAWLLENLVWTSAAMLLVLAIRRPVAQAFGAGAAYALWLIPLCRLLAPPADWLAAWLIAPLPSLPPLIVVADGGAGAAPPPLDGPGQWVPILLALWAGGALLFLGFQALRYRRFLRRLDPLADAGTHGGVKLVTSVAADGPLAMGLIRRRIVVPADFSQRYTPDEQRLALDHEAYHHRRRDIFANHVALVVLALNWCNPIAWFAFRAFRADQELSCDAAIAAAASPEERSDYARALVKSASPPGLVSACPLNSADQLKRRLKMLPTHRRAPRRLLAGSAIAFTLAATSLLVGAPVQAQDSQERSAEPKQERERVIILDRRDGAAPAANGTERREIRIHRNGDGTITSEGLDPEIARRIEGCRDANNELANIDEGNANQRTRIVLCTEGGSSGTANVEALQRARERIAGESELSGEARQRVLAEIDRAIARARARN